MRRATFLVVALAGSSAAQAQLDIRIDLSNLSGTTAGNWNNIQFAGALTSNLIDFHTGLGTGVNLDGRNSAWADSQGDTTGHFATADWMVGSAAADGVRVGAGSQHGVVTGTYTLTGLTGSGYEIELVSARTPQTPAGGYQASWDVNGANADRTHTFTQVTRPWDAEVADTNSNWLIWNSVAPVGGSITILMTIPEGTGIGIFNALHVAQVPAPGVGMALIAGLGLISRRRRA